MSQLNIKTLSGQHLLLNVVPLQFDSPLFNLFLPFEFYLIGISIWFTPHRYWLNIIISRGEKHCENLGSTIHQIHLCADRTNSLSTKQQQHLGICMHALSLCCGGGPNTHGYSLSPCSHLCIMWYLVRRLSLHKCTMVP